MRGFPLLNLLAILAILAGFAVPLLRLSRPAAAPGPVVHAETGMSSAAAGTLIPVTLALRFTQEPLTVMVSAEGVEISLRGEGLERRAEVPLALRDGSLEFSVKATWPAGVPSGVIEFRAAPDGWSEQSQNLWSDESGVDEWVRFTWRKPA